MPAPGAAGTARVYYIPAPATLTTGGSVTSFNGVAGWEEYIIVDCLIKAAFKQELDPALLIKQKSDMIDRIKLSLSRMDGAEPDTIRDVYAETLEDL
jgi:hypothetical protein